MGVVVTGAQGFVGLNVCRTLATQGETVYAVGRRPPDEWVLGYLKEVDDSVHHRVADLREAGTMAAALEDDNVDQVIHAAVITATTLDVERRDSLQIVEVNTGGTMQALDVACRKNAGRFVYVSSPSAIGPIDGTAPILETVALQPQTLYGITKMTSEVLVRRYGWLHDLSTVSVRIAQPYGPGERATPSRVRTSPIYEWLLQAEAGEVLATGPLDRIRDWTYINDTAQGICRLAMADDLQHDLYHLGTGKEVTVGQVIDGLKTAFPGLLIDEHPAPDSLNPNISGRSRPPLDVSWFRSEFDWSPETGIDDGIHRYIEWWRDSDR